MSQPNITLYIDWLSQPCRAVALLLKECNIPFNTIPIALQKGDTRTAEFKKINPAGKVPIIIDNSNSGIIINESHSIMRYICRQYNNQSPQLQHWYPQSNTLTVTRIDQWLDWHHLNLRLAVVKLISGQVFYPAAGRSEYDINLILKEGNSLLKSSLNYINNAVINQLYLAGNEISIADLSLSAEIAQLGLTGSSISPYPALQAWFNRVQQLQHWAEVNTVLQKVIKSKAAKAKQSTVKPNNTAATESTATTATEWSTAAQTLKSSAIFTEIKRSLSDPEAAEAIEKLKSIFKYTISGPNNTKINWIVDLKNDSGSVYEEPIDTVNPIKPDVHFTLNDDNFVKLSTGNLNPQLAFVSGKLKLQGNLSKAMQFDREVFQKQKGKILEAMKKIGVIKAKL